jgi:hypothetical protein
VVLFISIVLLALTYFKIIPMYLKYIYYKRQGMPVIRFPLPMIGNVLSLVKARKTFDKYSQHVLVEWYNKAFNNKTPGVFIEFKTNDGAVIFSDPELVNEIYITKNKYFDKHPRSKTILYEAVGNSILFANSDELWSQKRKHLSVAFYKDKLTSMLQIIIIQTLNYTK